jgi:exodeoxyribonuclease-1
VLLSLGPRPDYSGEVLCIDVGIDPASYASLSSADLVDKIARGSVARPICPVRLNKMPMVFRLNDRLISSALPHDVDALIARVRRLSQDRAFYDRVMEAATLRQEGFEASAHVEEQLYSGGFISNSDAARQARFHLADPEGKLQLVDQFDDGRLRTLGLRVVFDEHPALLPPDVRERLDAEVAGRMHAGTSVPWTTIASALQEIDKGFVQSRGKTRDLLTDYRQYLIDVGGFGQAAQ